MQSEKGFSLIETLIALALMGIIAVAFLSGMSTSFKGIMVSQERVAAESLGKSQLEYIKSQDYIPIAEYNPEDPVERYQLITISENPFSLCICDTRCRCLDSRRRLWYIQRSLTLCLTAFVRFALA